MSPDTKGFEDVLVCADDACAHGAYGEVGCGSTGCPTPAWQAALAAMRAFFHRPGVEWPAHDTVDEKCRHCSESARVALAAGLSALAGAGRLLPEDTRTEYGAFHLYERGDSLMATFGTSGEAEEWVVVMLEAAAQAADAAELGPFRYEIRQRQRWVGPWVPVPEPTDDGFSDSTPHGPAVPEEKQPEGDGHG